MSDIESDSPARLWELHSEPERLRAQHRDDFFAAAVELIAKRGLEATQASDIAQRSGLGVDEAQEFFRSKDDLLLQALRWSEEGLVRQILEELPRLDRASERLVRLVELAAPTGPRDEGWVLWLEVWSLAPHDLGFVVAEGANNRRWTKSLIDVIRDGQVRGEFAPDVDPEDFSVRLSALIDGLAIQVVGGLPDMTARRLKDICLSVASRELDCDFAGPTSMGSRAV